MADGTRGPDHVRLVMIKAMRALTRYAAGIEDTGQGDPDFRSVDKHRRLTANPITGEYPEIDQNGYRGMGNLLRHSYHRVDDEIVRSTVKEDLPELKRLAENILNRLSAKGPDE